MSAQDAIQIVDMEGRVIYTSDIQNQKFEIDISQFSSGVYVVRLNTSLGTATKKLTIAR
ncbi:MAG: T9SS type A sorting domain-containing protein [Bacteroidales bacterium]|nr:T9SS type A sorting domain-containing protein [Bacteroidales bacterium]